MDVELFENCTCFNLRKAARAVTQMYDEALKPLGLRATQVSALAMISSEGPITMTILAKQMVMDRTTLTRNLKPLIAENMVKVIAGEDRRQREVQLTDFGQLHLDTAIPVWAKVQKSIVTTMGDKNWNTLMLDLRSAVNAVRKQE